MKDMDAMMPTYGGHCTFWWSLLELAENRRNGWFSVLLAVSGKSMWGLGANRKGRLYSETLRKLMSRLLLVSSDLLAGAQCGAVLYNWCLEWCAHRPPLLKAPLLIESVDSVWLYGRHTAVVWHLRRRMTRPAGCVITCLPQAVCRGWQRAWSCSLVIPAS